VFAEQHEVAADQRWLIAVAFGLTVIGSVTLKGAPGQGLAALTLDEQTWIVIVLKIGLRALGFRVMGGLDGKAGFLEVVIPARGATGTGFNAQVEVLDGRLIGHHAAVLQVGGGFIQLGKPRLVIAEYQQMGVPGVFEVVMNTFFAAQALDEVQVRLVVLDAVFSRRVNRVQSKLVGIAKDCVFFKDLADDLRNRALLENTLIGAMS